MGFREFAAAPPEKQAAYLKHLEEREKEGNVLTDKNGAVYSPDFTKLLRISPGYKDESFAVTVGIKEIGKKAFYMCENLELIVIPNSVEIIDDEAFRDCKPLKYIVIPSRFKDKPYFREWAVSFLYY